LEQIYGEKLKTAGKIELKWLESTLFLNRGDHFEVHAFGRSRRRWRLAFGLCVADFDGDGNEDLFLSQNFLRSEARPPAATPDSAFVYSAMDDGEFRPLDNRASGIQHSWRTARRGSL